MRAGECSRWPITPAVNDIKFPMQSAGLEIYISDLFRSGEYDDAFVYSEKNVLMNTGRSNLNSRHEPP